MKKIFLTATILASVSAGNSFAKTEGSYLGVDALSVRTSYFTRAETNSGGWKNYKPTQYGSTYGAGLHYNYAFNANGFFIAPGVIFEQDTFNKTATKGTDADSLKVTSRYGVKTDIGYDITETIAPYLTGGYAAVKYRSVSNGFDGSSNLVTSSNSGTDFNWFYGAGVKFTLSKKVSVNFEYNHQSFMAKSTIPNGVTNIKYYNQVGKMDIAKVGISYNF